jgi:hypothetical protein
MGEYLVRQKTNRKGSLAFKITRNISKSIVNQAVLIDIENYLLNFDRL